MTALEIALAFVFVSNAVFLVGAGIVLHRILEHTRIGHEALLHAAGETRNAGKQLQHLAHVSHERLGKLAEGGTSAGPGPDTAAIAKLTKLVQDLAARQGGIDGPEGEEGGGERPHRSELDRALAHNHRLRSSLAQVRVQLEEAMKTVADMQRRERDTSTEALENMRQLVTRLNTQLEQARRKARDAEKRAIALDNELQQVRNTIQTSESREELVALQERLDTMQRENSNLTGEVDELKELIQRTLREKNFIEDRFVALDDALEGRVADAATPPASAAVQG